MADPQLETLFTTFRTTRDSSALATIFDATASELLLVAVHLVGDRAEAEDLVQTTFVEVIERAEQYDASRPLKPWLVGILANRAKMSLRRRKRAPSHEVGEPEATEQKTNPVLAAEAQEAAQHVSRALDELPSHYRHILVLHLVHGLGGVQIAQSLDRPPATVRTQIKRGLEMLRSALPAALAVPVILLATEGRGLAAVRSTVMKVALEKAGEVAIVGAGVSAGTAAAIAAGGFVAMKKVMIAAVCVVLGLGIYFGFESGFASVEPTDALEVSVTASKSSSPIQRSDDGAKPMPAARESVHTEPAASTEVIVTGRCLESNTGKPHTASWIVVRANLNIRTTLANHGRPDPSQSWPKQVALSSSSADGRFELRFDFDKSLSYRIELNGDSFVGLSGQLSVAGPGQHSLGDIYVHPGSRIRGRIVDKDGQALAQVVLLLEFKSPSLRRDPAWSTTSVQSSDDGTFSMHKDHRVLIGTVKVLPTKGYTLIKPSEFEVTEDSAFREQVIVLHKKAAADTISGRLLNQEAQGIPGIELKVKGRTTGGIQQTYRTKPDGSFTIYRDASDNEQVTIIADGMASTVPLKSKPVAWGTANLKLIAQRSQQIQIQVIDAATHEPIEDYAVVVRWSDDPIKSRAGRGTRHPEKHPNGLLSLPSIGNTGSLAILVVPFADTYEMSDYQQFDLSALSTTAIPIELHKKRQVFADIVDVDGLPVSKAKVQLVQLLRDQDLDSDCLVLGRSQVHWNLRTGSGDWPHAFELAKAESNALGRAELSCIDAGRRIGLVVEAAGYIKQMSTAISLPATGEALKITIERSGTITGSINFGEQRYRFERSTTRDAAPNLGAVKVAIRRPGKGLLSLNGGRNYGHTIQADGTFKIDGLAPGQWEVVLHWWRPLNANSRRGTVIEPALTSVTLNSGQALKVELDATAHLPAMISGTVTSNGQVLRNSKITFTRRWENKQGRPTTEDGIAGVSTDHEGRFSTAGLLAGDYLIQVISTNNDGNPETRRSNRWITLQRGASFDQIFDVTVRSISLNLVSSQGAALANQIVTILCDEFCRSWTLKSDARGSVQFRDAGGSSYRILLHKPGIILNKKEDWAKASTRTPESSASVSVPYGKSNYKASVDIR